MISNVHVYKVEGMTCNHCKATVEKGLKELEQITEVIADPDSNRVTLQADTISESQVKETIEKLGYSFGGSL